MNRLIIYFVLLILIMVSCAKRNFKYVDNEAFIRQLELETEREYENFRLSSSELADSRYFLGITLKDTFLGGELTFTQTAHFDYRKPCIQYCYILFDHFDNCYYNTVSIDNILDSMITPEIPYEVGLDTLTINDAPDALQGKYSIKGDTLRMIMESKEQDEFVNIIAKLNHGGENSFTILRITRERLTFSPLFTHNNSRSKQKVFSTEDVFSIPLKFQRIQEYEKVVIRRDTLTKMSKGTLF